MNRFAYQTTGLAIRALSGLSKANIHVHGAENIPRGSLVFAVNHFTRIETLILPGYIYELTDTPVWSLADYTLFRGALKTWLDRVGAVSTRDPGRDQLMTRTLLNGEANWLVFPEGRMVKNKKIFDRGQFMILSDEGRHPPHTGVAALALRTEFYRQRLRAVSGFFPQEARRLITHFDISDPEAVMARKTWIVPVNLTYFPLRTHENVLTRLAGWVSEDITERAMEEIMTEGSMLLSGVDLDIRFGKPIDILEFMDHRTIRRAIDSREETPPGDQHLSSKAFRQIAHKIMIRYMTDIYAMTTVNHDHLFSSMIRQMLFRKIDPEDLRRRVFLATALDIKATGFFHHQSLDTDQTCLLTDDRHGKFRDFMAVAMEKGVVREFADGLRKNRDMFSSPFDFHQVRMENPVSVMANEVEPLTWLQKEIRRLAWLPAFEIRRRTAQTLMKQAVTEFEKDYSQFYIEGESRPWEIGVPFYLRGKGRKTGVLLVHGYMAAPLELAELAEYLGQKGFHVYVPRLRGHGTSPEDLNTRTYADWEASVERGYAVIRTLCDHVFVGGFSTGAALALDLAARIPEIKGVFAICPPRRLQDPSLKMNIAKDLWTRLREMVGRESPVKEEEFIPNQGENPHISYSRNPVAGIREIERFMDELEPKLKQIQTPALVIHSRLDPVTDHKNSRRIFELLGSPDKQYVLFNFKRHGIIAGKGAERVFDTIAGFMDSVDLSGR